MASQFLLAKRKRDKKGEHMNWYVEVLKKYAVFDGRARRSEYWYFFLFNFIVGFVLGLVDIGLTAVLGMGFLSGLYGLAVFIPGIAVSARRLHDINRSGWWLLIAFIPVIGALVLLFFMVQDSMPGKNQFGDNPKETAA